MGEKVKVTQEQQHLIDQWMDNKVGLVNIFVDRNAHKGSILYSFTLDQLIKSLYVGYEVEPEFERGQYIVYKSGDIRQVVNVYAECLEIEDSDGDRFFWNKKYVRHATESEIAQEENRRTDKKLNDFISNLANWERDRLYGILVDGSHE